MFCKKNVDQERVMRGKEVMIYHWRWIHEPDFALKSVNKWFCSRQKSFNLTTGHTFDLSRFLIFVRFSTMNFVEDTYESMSHDCPTKELDYNNKWKMFLFLQKRVDDGSFLHFNFRLARTRGRCSSCLYAANVEYAFYSSNRCVLDSYPKRACAFLSVECIFLR